MLIARLMAVRLPRWLHACHDISHLPRWLLKCHGGFTFANLLQVCLAGCMSAKLALKVLTNEKRGGLNLVSFDLSRFKLFTLKFSKESVQTPSCERRKTAQRSLFLSFEINNYYPITV
jgi:hypothetical protein